MQPGSAILTETYQAINPYLFGVRNLQRHYRKRQKKNCYQKDFFKISSDHFFIGPFTILVSDCKKQCNITPQFIIE
jgi:hypothetical protein